MRFLATFTPQAWQNDYAIDVDAEGPTTWDATGFIRDPANKINEGDVLEGIKDEGSWLDKDDVLKSDTNAPEWVREWSGPFTIMVEGEDGEPLTQEQRERVASAVGYGMDDEAIREALDRVDGTPSVADAQRVLGEKVGAFTKAGGRGVELADEIDALRVYVAVNG